MPFLILVIAIAARFICPIVMDRILGFRPLTKEEQDSCHSVDGHADKSAKDNLKSRKAHLDICSDT